MLRPLMTIGVLMLIAGCSTVSMNTKDDAEVFTVIPCETPSFVQGSPVYHAEMAVDIAEYVLTKQGIDCRDHRTSVSFCEGVYTVAFLSGKKQPESKYTVDIDAGTSKILFVQRMTRDLLSTQSSVGSQIILRTASR
jgi:hypothetical protein